MGWKTINGRRYYYKSEREGGRVKTTYSGAGESGLLIYSCSGIIGPSDEVTCAAALLHADGAPRSAIDAKPVVGAGRDRCRCRIAVERIATRRRPTRARPMRAALPTNVPMNTRGRCCT